MASRSERRAALQRMSDQPTADEVADYTAEDPMKIQFTHVRFHRTIAKLDPGLGQLTGETAHFDAIKHGVTIEFDTSTQLVRLSKGTACTYIPIHGVEFFGPTLEDAAAKK